MKTPEKNRHIGIALNFMKIKTNVTEKTPDDATVISWLGRITASVTMKATSSNNIKQITKAVVHGILITYLRRLILSSFTEINNLVFLWLTLNYEIYRVWNEKHLIWILCFKGYRFLPVLAQFPKRNSLILPKKNNFGMLA